MASLNKNQLTRPNNKRYRQRTPKTRKMNSRIFVGMEGSKTEPKYLRNLKALFTQIKFEIIQTGSHSAPVNILKKMKETIKNDLRDKGRNAKRDKAFLIFDDDGRTQKEFEQAISWQKSDPENNYIVLSRPCFELWLLYHFEDCVGIQTKQECIKRLKEQWKKYEKNYQKSFTEDEVFKAMDRALAKCSTFDDAFSNQACTAMGAFVKLLNQLNKKRQ